MIRTANITTQLREAAVVTSLITLALLAQGCSSVKQPEQVIQHVVLCWLKEPGNTVHRRQLIETSRTFENIPGVLSVHAGTAVPATRRIEDSSFDVGIVVSVRDKAALSAYQAHPVHQQALTNILTPLVNRIQVYDIRSD